MMMVGLSEAEVLVLVQVSYAWFLSVLHRLTTASVDCIARSRRRRFRAGAEGHRSFQIVASPPNLADPKKLCLGPIF